MPERDVVYIVSYSKGEYSDHYDWPVAWYEKREDAQAHVDEWERMRKEVTADFPATDRDHYSPREMTPAVSAFLRATGEAHEGKKFYPYEIYDFNDPTISEIPKGVLPLHGMTP